MMVNTIDTRLSTISTFQKQFSFLADSRLSGHTQHQVLTLHVVVDHTCDVAWQVHASWMKRWDPERYGGFLSHGGTPSYHPFL